MQLSQPNSIFHANHRHGKRTNQQVIMQTRKVELKVKRYIIYQKTCPLNKRVTIGKLQQSIFQLNQTILLVQPPKNPTHIVNTTNWKSFNETNR